MSEEKYDEVRPDWVYGKEEAWRALTARCRKEDDEWNALRTGTRRTAAAGGHIGRETVGERCMANKKIPMRTNAYHDDVHPREGDQIHIPL